jgi:hypothetical protein
MKYLVLGTLLPLSMVALPAQADIYVVASAQSPLRMETSKDIQALYMGRTRTLEGAGDNIVQPVDLPKTSELRQQFYKVLTGWTPAQVNSYWARLLFTGQVTPPLMMPSEAALEEHLRKNPAAVGYLPRLPTDGKLKVLAVLRTEEGQ